VDCALGRTVDDVIAARDGVHEQRQQMPRMMLEVFVHRRHPVPARMENARDGGAVLTEVSRKMNDSDPGVISLQLAEYLHGVVHRGVIDEDRLDQLDR